MSGSPQQNFATTTSSRQMGLPDWLMGGMQNASQLAGNATQNNQTYAPFSQSTQQGLGQIESMGANPASIPGYNNAFQQYNDTLGGNYLAGGQGFDQALTAAQNRIIPTVTSAFNSSGRMTGNAGQSELASRIGDSFAGLYNNERQRQMGALGMAPQMQNLAFDPANRMLGAGAVREAKTLEEQQDEIKRAQQQAGLLGQIAPFYAQQSGTEDKPYFTGGGGIGEYLGAGLGLAGMLGGNSGLGSIFGGGGSAGGGASADGGGGVSAPPGGSSLANSLFGGGGAGSFAFPATLGAAGSSLGMGATGAMTAAELAGAAPFAFPSSLGLGGGAVGGTTGMAAGGGAAPAGLLSGGAGTALGAAAPLAVAAFGAMRQGSRQKAERAAFAPYWQQVQSAPRQTFQTASGSVTGRPFTDPKTGQLFIMHGNDDIGTGRSMAVTDPRTGETGLWSPKVGFAPGGGSIRSAEEQALLDHKARTANFDPEGSGYEA